MQQCSLLASAADLLRDVDGSADDAGVKTAMDAYTKRTGRDASRYFAIGDEAAILERIGEYVAVGVEKFILRPVGPDMMSQTRRLIEKVLPAVEAKWPKKMAMAG